jgi:hypothetical protein
MSEGVLHVTYVDRGKAAITPAFATPAIRQACARAGHPLGTVAPARTRSARPDLRIGIAPPRAAPPPSARFTAEPTFVAQAGGSLISIDSRNDGDTAPHCMLDFSRACDGEPGGSRAVTIQATLPARQTNRVVSISGTCRNVRFITLPRWHCTASP